MTLRFGLEMVERLVRPLLVIMLVIVLIWKGPIFLPLTYSASGPSILYPGLSFPASFRFAPDGRIFFTEKNTGNIRIIQNGTLVPSPFASLTVATDGTEQGLLGIALSPNFQSDRFVYVYYTDWDGTTYHGRIARFTAIGNSGTGRASIFDVADPTPSSTNHDGGYLRFGPDGKLYVQVGEFADPNQSQNSLSMAGKILRMNPDGTVPSDNPFPNSLVYALGIRNGFGMDFDRQTGQLVETEAGPDRDDEINIIVAGGNYGWPICMDTCGNPSFINPIASFTPVVTPTGIAYASPRTYYFGEWTGASLQKLTLTEFSTVASISQVWSSPNLYNGVTDVALGPDQKIYFSTSTEIYQYDISGAQQPVQPTSYWTIIIYVAIAGAAIVVAIVVVVSRLKHRRPSAGSLDVPSFSSVLAAKSYG